MSLGQTEAEMNARGEGQRELVLQMPVAFVPPQKGVWAAAGLPLTAEVVTRCV